MNRKLEDLTTQEHVEIHLQNLDKFNEILNLMQNFKTDLEKCKKIVNEHTGLLNKLNNPDKWWR